MEAATANTTSINESPGVNLYYILNVYLMVVFSVISLLGTIGNGLVIWFAAFKMKKTVNCVWFLSLAIADLTFSLFLPIRVAHLAHYTWNLGSFLCKFYIFVLFLNLFASILHLTIISIDHCISVVFPVWCQNHRTPRLAMKICLAVWIFAIAFSLPSFIFTETEDRGDYIDCNEDQFSKSGQLIRDHQVIIRFIIFFVLPFAIIVTCYSVIFWHIRRNRMITSTRTFKVILAVIISFFVCWFPYHLCWLMTMDAIMYLQGYAGAVFEISFDLATGLAFANSCINPVLYVFIGRDFKEKCLRSIQPNLERVFSEDSRITETRRNGDSQLFSVTDATSQL